MAVMTALVYIVFHRVTMLLQQRRGHENLNSSLAGLPQTAAHQVCMCVCVRDPVSVSEPGPFGRGGIPIGSLKHGQINK